MFKVGLWKTEDEMVRWHPQLNGYEFEQTLRDREGQGELELRPCDQEVSILVGSGLLGQHRCVHQAPEPTTDPASAPRHRSVGAFQFNQAPFQHCPQS